MNPDSHQRPTFSQALEELEPMREMAERGELVAYKPEVTKSTEPEAMSAVVGQISAIAEGESEGQFGSKESSKSKT